MPRYLTTQQLADLLGVECWRVQRVFESGDVPEPARFAGKRAIPSELLPLIVDALRAHGWLPAKPTGAGS
jgi:hypothetical protein